MTHATAYAEQRELAHAIVRAALNQRAEGRPSTLADLIDAAWSGQEHVDKVIINYSVGDVRDV